MWQKACTHCKGTGNQIDHEALGADMRKEREAAGVSLRSMAKAMAFSAAFLSDLERGRRNWSDASFKFYQAEIKKAEAAKRNAKRKDKK